MIYIHDNTFEGILTCIFYAFLYKENPDRIVPKANSQISLLDECRHFEKDIKKANRVYSSIRKKISKEAEYKILRAGLSSDLEAGGIIFEYYKRGLKMGRKINNDFSNDIVMKIEKLKDNVVNETHKYKGFLRFEKIEDEIFYAPYRPNNNITSLLCSHFANRMKNEKWIIHDKGRNIAAFYNSKEWIISDFLFDVSKYNSTEETKIKDLWTAFFHAVSIKEREDRKRHIQHMPLKYREFLTEKINPAFLRKPGD